MVSKCDDASPRERRNIHNGAWMKTPGVMKCVAKNESAFGIGVEDFDRLTRGTGGDVAGLHRVTTRHVLDSGYQPHDSHGKSQLCDKAHRCDDGCGAAHVELHLIHRRRVLE